MLDVQAGRRKAKESGRPAPKKRARRTAEGSSSSSSGLLTGEEAVKLLACLERHCTDRGLEKDPGPLDEMWMSEEKKAQWYRADAMYLGGRCANYWVCGTRLLAFLVLHCSCVQRTPIRKMTYLNSLWSWRRRRSLAP